MFCECIKGREFTVVCWFWPERLSMVQTMQQVGLYKIRHQCTNLALVKELRKHKEIEGKPWTNGKDLIIFEIRNYKCRSGINVDTQVH